MENDAARNEGGRVPFGKEMAKQFLIDPSYRFLNQGSFGTYPRMVRDRRLELLDDCESHPDNFILYKYPALLMESRVSVAKILKVDVSTVVLVPNATTGVNTVLRNLTWNPDGKDEILFFNFIYGACGKTIDYVCEANLDLVSSREIKVSLPFSDDQLLSNFIEAITLSRSSGRRPRIALYDTIVSRPGIRLPFEKLTALCASEGILSLIDGAHGIGQIPIDLSTLQPDFFVSNCHKWLYIPRGCAVFYVPLKNQALMRSTLPTGHSFVPKETSTQRGSFLQDKSQDWASAFTYVGTIDYTPNLCIPEAVRFREEVCGGEEAIMNYCMDLTARGGRRVAEILGTKILDNEEGTLSRCSMINVQLPLFQGPDMTVAESTAESVVKEQAQIMSWMMKVMIDEYKTFIPVFEAEGTLWVRLSGQIYLDMEDFEWAGQILQTLVKRSLALEWRQAVENGEAE